MSLFCATCKINWQVWLHKLGTEQSSDSCLYHEKDEKFFLHLNVSESEKYLFVAPGSKTTRFIFYLDTSKPEEGLKVLTPRTEGVSTYASHRGDHFFIRRRTDVCFNSELLACPVENPSAMTLLLPHRERQGSLLSFSLLLFFRESIIVSCAWL